MRSISITLILALAGCATASGTHPDTHDLPTTARRTLWIDNRTADALVVRVDGVRTATILSQRGACIALPAPGQALTARAIGRQQNYAAPGIIPQHAAAWSWSIRPALGTPGSTLDLQPAEPCRVR
jgi:hypothetical protein